MVNFARLLFYEVIEILELLLLLELTKNDKTTTYTVVLLEVN